MVQGRGYGPVKNYMKKQHKIKAVIICLVLFVSVFSLTAFADEKGAAPDNGIPVVTVVIDESRGTIAAMNESEDHSVKCYGTIRIDVPEGFHYSDYFDTPCDSLAECGMEIRGRGNSTWSASKKPYKIRLNDKVGVLGFKKNRHWVLIANAFDRTLIKDRMTGWLGDAIGLEFTPRGVPVDLVMKNTDGSYDKYLGSYYLSENVRVDKNRIEINELKKGDTEQDKITGGYLVQGGVQTDEGSPSKFYTSRGADWANKTPSFDPEDDGYENDAQKKYIRNYMQDVEDALYERDFDAKDGTSYRDMMDLESAAKYWLIDQVSMNADGYGTGSTYVYKKEDTVADGVTVPGKLYWGPLWDFDYAWYYDQGDNYKEFRNPAHEWLYPMMYDIGPGGFVQEIRKQWPALKASLEELTADGGVIDKYYEETKRSQAGDNKINPHDDDGDGIPDEYQYEDEIKALKAWIIKRTQWLDRHIMHTHELEDTISVITLEADGEVVDRVFKQTGAGFYGLDEAPDKEGYTFIEWTRENGEPLREDDVLTGDITLVAQYIPDSEATHAKELFFRSAVMYVDINDLYGNIYIPCTIIPENAQDKKVYWTSSDEETAKAEPNGTVKVNKPGTVTITGRLKSGFTKSYTLVISDGGLEEVRALKVRRSEITLKKGQYSQVEVTPVPEKAAIDFVDYRSNNEKVVTVDENGVLRAMGAGTATIRVVLSVVDEAGKTRDISAKCKVYVTGANTMKTGGKTVTLKSSELKRRSKTIKRAKAITVKKAQGKVTYKLSGVTKKKYRKYFKVAKTTGSMTVKKGLPKGTYKLRIKVRAAGDKAFRPKTETVTVKVRVR